MNHVLTRLDLADSLLCSLPSRVGLQEARSFQAFEPSEYELTERCPLSLLPI